MKGSVVAMRWLLTVVSVGFVSWVLGVEAAAAQSKAESTPTTAKAVASSPADDYFAPIARDLKNLYDSLRSKSQIDERDQAVISQLRDRAAEFSKKFPDDVRGLAAQLTLS